MSRGYKNEIPSFIPSLHPTATFFLRFVYWTLASRILPVTRHLSAVIQEQKNTILSKFYDQITIRISTLFTLLQTQKKVSNLGCVVVVVVVFVLKFTGLGNWPFSSPQTQSYLLYGHPAEEIHKLKDSISWPLTQTLTLQLTVANVA